MNPPKRFTILTITPTSPSDYSNAINLHNTVFGHITDETRYTPEVTYHKVKDTKDPKIFEARDYDNQLIGFALCYQRYPDFYHIWHLGVDETARGQGVATMLYEIIEKFANDHGYKGVTLNTFNKFPHNLRLAIKRGYQIYDLEKTDTSDPKINMRLVFKQLSAPPSPSS